MNFNFGEVLTRAWQIIWKHKVLWIFGILASCSRGGGGGSGGSGYQTSAPSGQSPFPQFERAMEQFGQWIGENLWVIALFILVILVLVVLAILLGTIGKIGLIRGTSKAEQGAEQLIFRELFSESMPYFWRVFGLSFLIGLAFLILFIPLIAFGALTAGIGFICLLPLICLLVPVSLIIGVVIEQANNAMVLEDLGILDGLRRGWEVFKSNFGAIIIMAIILAVIGFAVGLVVAIPILLVVLPATFAFVVGNEQSTTPLALIGVCICLYLPIALVLQGIMVAYIQSAWTLTYMRLTGKAGDSGQPRLDDNRPVGPDDSDKTMISTEPMDSNKTLIAAEPTDDNKTVIAKKPNA